MDDPVARDWRFLKVEREGPTVVVRLHRPDARNALNTSLMVELTEFARGIRRRTDVSTVILTGSDRYFSAGADLAAQGDRRRTSLLETREAVMAGPDMCEAWEQVEAVTIAAIEGYCIGGGCALAAACDFRVMGEGAYLRGRARGQQSAWAEAASDYIAALKGWPATWWAPDAVVELARALGRLGKTKESCQALAELSTRYPAAPEGTRKRAAAVAVQSGCAA